MNTSQQYKSGYVALVGEPNVGKSTLLNALLQQKLSIVTPKPQTTRHKIAGILSTENSQIVFLDTPGIIAPKYLLHQAMMKAVESALDDADIVFVLFDAEKVFRDEYSTEDEFFIKATAEHKKTFLILNKIDLFKKEEVLVLIDRLHALFPYDEIIPISSLKNFGMQELISTLNKYLPVNPPFFPTDIVAESSERFFVSEIIREKIFGLYGQEIPYSTSVDIIEFKERTKGKHYINAEIYVEKESQKGIIVGKEGKVIRKLGELARADIEKFLNHAVFLDLHVKVREGWREQNEWLKRLGYQ